MDVDKLVLIEHDLSLSCQNHIKKYLHWWSMGKTSSNLIIEEADQNLYMNNSCDVLKGADRWSLGRQVANYIFYHLRWTRWKCFDLHVSVVSYIKEKKQHFRANTISSIFFPSVYIVIWGKSPKLQHIKQQEVSCFLIFTTDQEAVLLLSLRLLSRSVFLYSCLPLNTSWSNPTAPKPSFFIFFPATDLPKFHPPTLPIVSPLSPSNPLLCKRYISNLTLHQKVILSARAPSWWDNESSALLQMLFVESCSNSLHRPLTASSESFKKLKCDKISSVKAHFKSLCSASVFLLF